MIIEFELQGSRCLHKGLFDTTGFWVKYEVDKDDCISDGDAIINGYKIFSHFSFSFFHEDKAIVDLVYSVLIGCLRGSQGKDLPEIGYLRKLNK